MSEATATPPAPPAQPRQFPKAKEQPKALQPVEFAQPPACVGMGVVWYPFGETANPGMPGQVVEVGNRTLSLSIFLPNKTSLMYKDGVRHLSDPDAKREEFIDIGCWDYSEQTKELMALRAEVERLRVV